MVGPAALGAVYEIGCYGLSVWFVGRLRTVLSRAGVRRRLEQVSGGVLLLLGVRTALESYPPACRAERTVRKTCRPARAAPSVRAGCCPKTFTRPGRPG